MQTRVIRSLLVALCLLTTWQAQAASTLTLNFYDTNGNQLTYDQVQSLQLGPQTDAYYADAFVNPVTLAQISVTPMSNAKSLTFPLPSIKPVAFAINWPTSTQLYGLIILDNGGGGFSNTTTVNFTYQAALDIMRRLNAALAARADYTPSAAFAAAYNAASNCISIANANPADSSVQGAEGQMALDQLVVAYDLLLKEYGPVYSLNSIRAGKAPPLLAVTMESVSTYQTDMNKLAAMSGPFAWVRIVFQEGAAPSNYTAAVNYAKSLGIKILGQPVDSSADADYTDSQFMIRMNQFVTAFPNIDVWEIGNEVNGGWSSPSVAARTANVAAYFKALGHKTHLTLFWQLNTTLTTNYSLFNWISNNLPSSVRANLDYVGLSLYQEQAPIGAAFDQVMRRLQVEFPNKPIGLGELGYWEDDQQFWQAYSTNVTTARDIVLSQYYNASLGYANSFGGCYWWDFSISGYSPDFDTNMDLSINAINNYLCTPFLAAHQWTNNSQMQFTVSGLPKLVFKVQSSQDLVNWQPLATITNVSGSNTFTLSATNQPASFYRLVQH